MGEIVFRIANISYYYCKQPVSSELHKMGLIELIGHFDVVTKCDIVFAIKSILSRNRFSSLSSNCASNITSNDHMLVVKEMLKYT